jgi:hypothetical protein
MPFEYACFISYPNGQRELLKKIVRDLHEALANEIELYIRDKKIFVDEKEIIGGEFYNEKLAKSICKSICMIVVFTPTYFNDEHLYCAREYRLMEKIEKARLKYLKERGLDNIGLIIPIVFRGEDVLPAEIKERRHVYFFERFYLSDVRICENQKYEEKIKEIAKIIHKISIKLDDLPEGFEDCDKFRLPEEKEIKEWLSKRKIHEPRLPYPGDKIEST